VSTDLKLEAVVIPVTDVDKAKAFYEQLEWRLDADFAFDNGFRVVQFTPPGSARGLYLVVSDIEAARNELAAHGIDVSAAFHPKTPGAQFQPDTSDRIAGPADERASYSSFATFSDPDGNTWLLQEITTRLPGRIDSGETSYSSVGDLQQALQRAAAAHGEHEKRNGGEFDEQWPEWYATYMVAEQSGQELPQ